MGGRVVETLALEALGSVGRQAAIVGTDGEHNEAGAHPLTVCEHQRPQSIALGHRRSDSLRGRWR